MAECSRDITVYFSDIHPAGILFYPCYLEMTNALIEDWFAEELGLSLQRTASRHRI